MLLSENLFMKGKDWIGIFVIILWIGMILQSLSWGESNPGYFIGQGIIPFCLILWAFKDKLFKKH